MSFGNALLEVRGLSGAIRTSESSRSVRRGSMGLVVAKDSRVNVSKGDIDHTVVGEELNSAQSNGFLTSTLGSSTHEHASGLAYEFSSLPESSSGVHKGLNIWTEEI